MIEAPEARYLCEQLTETVVGKRISDVFIQFSPHKFAWFNGNSDEFAEWLVDKRINSAQSQGGMVEITIEDKVLVLTDGVNLRYLTPGTKLPAKHQLLIGFEDESCLIASVRMYGGSCAMTRMLLRAYYPNITGQRKASRRSCRTLSAKNISSD